MIRVLFAFQSLNFASKLAPMVSKERFSSLARLHPSTSDAQLLHLKLIGY
ncbi:MAG: hypothetical protein RMK94_03795 [Armatimonadota bacterium]|nr:hypothetical protein [Armatimonadota bacterium]